jgi:UDP-2,3-diacylglucosamine pyrophosphatase LpxH
MLREPSFFADAAGGDILTRPSSRYRTIWISDVHLGTRACKAEFLLDFLRHTEAETIYLVGDIVDGWRLKKSWYWAQSHNDVIQKLLRKVRKGARVIYIPGNHDEWLRDYFEMHFGGVTVLPETVHETVDGRRLLVLHGDAYDSIVRYARWFTFLGDWACDLMVWVNNLVHLARRRLGYPYWSLAAAIKSRLKNAVQYVDNFARAMSDEARRRGLDGIVCGHIHTAEIREIDGVLYCNDGDWVESCTALVEHFDGRLEVLNWAEFQPAPIRAASAPAYAVTPLPGRFRASISSVARIVTRSGPAGDQSMPALVQRESEAAIPPSE